MIDNALKPGLQVRYYKEFNKVSSKQKGDRYFSGLWLEDAGLVFDKFIDVAGSYYKLDIKEDNSMIEVELGEKIRDGEPDIRLKTLREA